MSNAEDDAGVGVLSVQDVLVMDFEQYAARHGASTADIGDAGTHKRGRNQSDKQWKRLLSPVERRANKVLARRIELRSAYDAAVASGEIRPPTRDERLQAIASGHPDLASVQAARRILSKRYGGDLLSALAKDGE